MRRILAPVLAAAVLIAGCGSDTDETNSYVKQLNAAQTAFATAAGRVAEPAPEPGQSSSRRYRRTLRGYERAIATTITALRGMTVPAAVRNEHRQFVEAMVRFGRDVADARATLRHPTPRTVAAAPGRIQRAASTVNQRIVAVSTAINTKLGVS